AIGPPAWVCRSGARPSQNCAKFRLEFSTVGALIGPFCHRSPIDVGMLSVPPIDRLWHELHEMNPDFDSLGSKYSFLPSSAMPRSISLGGVIGCTSAQSSLVPCASAAVVVAAVSAAPMTASGIQRFCMFSLPVVMAARWYDALRR